MPAFSWTTDPNDAVKEQLTLRDELRTEGGKELLQNFTRGIAIGSAYDDATERACAVGILFDRTGQFGTQRLTAVLNIDFPYVPGLLAFRVGPAICSILDEAVDQIDLMMFDGQGIAHPRGFGLAAHLGLLYNTPSIGVTRNNLYGRVDRVPTERFDKSVISHPRNSKVMGFALCLEDDQPPCYVSPGHLISAEMAVEVVKQVSRKPMLFPDALRRAHAEANRMAKTQSP